MEIISGRVKTIRRRVVLFHIGLTDIGVAGAEIIGGIKIVGSAVGVADVGKFHAVVAFIDSAIKY